MGEEEDREPDVVNKFQSFMLNVKRIFSISTKPTRKEYWTMIKICLLGLALVGGMSFIVQLISSVLIPAPTTTTTTT